MTAEEMALLERFVVAQERQAEANAAYVELRREEIEILRQQLSTSLRIATAQERAAGTAAITDMHGMLENVRGALEALMAAWGTK